MTTNTIEDQLLNPGPNPPPTNDPDGLVRRRIRRELPDTIGDWDAASESVTLADAGQVVALKIGGKNYLRLPDPLDTLGSAPG